MNTIQKNMGFAAATAVATAIALTPTAYATDSPKITHKPIKEDQIKIELNKDKDAGSSLYATIIDKRTQQPIGRVNVSCENFPSFTVINLDTGSKEYITPDGQVLVGAEYVVSLVGQKIQTEANALWEPKEGRGVMRESLVGDASSFLVIDPTPMCKGGVPAFPTLKVVAGAYNTLGELYAKNIKLPAPLPPPSTEEERRVDKSDPSKLHYNYSRDEEEPRRATGSLEWDQSTGGPSADKREAYLFNFCGADPIVDITHIPNTTKPTPDGLWVSAIAYNISVDERGKEQAQIKLTYSKEQDSHLQWATIAKNVMAPPISNFCGPDGLARKVSGEDLSKWNADLVRRFDDYMAKRRPGQEADLQEQ